MLRTAKEAREIVENKRAEIEVEKENEVIKKIEEAINKLETQCCIDGVLPEKLEKKLKDNGYEVEVRGQFNENDTYISW